MADYDVEGKNEISRAAVLPDFTIHAGLHQGAGPWVDFIGNHGANRAERIKTLGSGPLAVFFLQVTGRDIVDASVAEYVGTNILVRADFIAGLGHHDPELPFMVDALRDFRASNLAAGRQQSRWRFQEDQWLNRDVVAEFSGMLTIVAAHANDLGGSNRG
jgi:hypothetical protein